MKEEKKVNSLDDIRETAKKLAEKNTWVRKATKELMDDWKELSWCGERLYSDTELFVFQENVGDMGFNLVTGTNELKNWFESVEDAVDISNEFVFHEALTMSELREFLQLFPKMVEEIYGKMNKKIQAAENIENMLKKLK